MSNNIINQSLKTSVVNYVGIFLGAVFTLYLSPKFFSTGYNGLYRLLIEYATVAGTYFHFGIPSIINKYFHRIFDSSDKSTRGFDFVVLVVPLIAIGLFSGALVAFKDPATRFLTGENDFSLVSKYLLFIIPLILFNAYSMILEAYTAMYGNIVKVNFYRNIVVKLFNIASVGAYALTQNFTLTMSIVGVGVIFSMVMSFVNLGRMKEWKLDFTPTLEFLRVRGLTRDFFKYALYLILGNLTPFLMTKIDVFFVGKLANLSDVAYYTTAMFFVAFITVPYQAVLNISFPYISKAFTSGSKTELNQTVKDNALFGFSLSLFIALSIWVNIDAVYAIMPNGELYSAGKYAFLILCLGRLFDISIGSTGQLITVSKWYMISLYFSIGISTISIFLGYFLTLELGIYGSALSMAICSLLYVTYQLALLKIKMKTSPYNRKFLYMLILILPILGISYGIDLIIHNVWINLMVKSLLITAVYFGSIYRFNLNTEIKNIIDAVIRKIK